MLACMLTLIVGLVAGAMLYRHFVTNRIMDRGGMENADAVSNAEILETVKPTDSSEISTEENEAYKSTIIVSSIEELVAAVGNDTCIVLKAGTYNFSKLDGSELNNPSIEVSAFGGIYEFTISGVSNLSIEAETDAEVTIVTEYAADPVLCFEYCSSIRLKGLTCGHDVAPGYCSGSVISAYRIKGLSIEDCRLYGSGTYGVETDESADITVKNTDIYECTVGIIRLYDTWNTAISDCRFYRNKGYSMFSFSDSYDILVEDTEIFENETIFTAPYPEAIEYTGSEGITFKNCVFRDNSVEPEPEGLVDIFFDHCSIS